MGDLRPISLCIVLVKIVTKVMANRMKEFLKDIIAENQSEFVPGRLFSDNIMISYEVMHHLKRKRKGREGSMVVKLVMSKTYDRIEWSFLRALLQKLGFDDLWIHLTLQCVTTVSYVVTHGSREMESINPTRGIRKGDPLSPYLFILCAQGLSALINKYETEKWLHGVRINRRAPTISHMFFEDDCYIYCMANVEEAGNMFEMLELYEKATGHKVNTLKLSVFFSTNKAAQNHASICEALHMTEVDENSKYLGLPRILGRNKSRLLGYLKNKDMTRVQRWDGRWISKGGKEILIKNAAQTIPSFSMSVFLLPLEITKEIERVLSKYWWNSESSQNLSFH